MSVEDDGDARKDVNASGVLTLLDAGEIRRINAGKQRQIPGLHLLDLTQLPDTVANARALILTVTRTDAHGRNCIADEFPADAVDHLLLVIGKVPVEDEFNQVEDVVLVLVAVILGQI